RFYGIRDRAPKGLLWGVIAQKAQNLSLKMDKSTDSSTASQSHGFHTCQMKGSRKWIIRSFGEGRPDARGGLKQLISSTKHENFMLDEEALVVKKRIRINQDGSSDGTAAKAKLLLRELKTVKADLACLRKSAIRLQLERLLAEKARLAHENSVYARGERFLREIVEYHQLTMQDVVYIGRRK
ncbi:unnamed protein product, partial [Thlaspi arvense]